MNRTCRRVVDAEVMEMKMQREEAQRIAAASESAAERSGGNGGNGKKLERQG